MDFSKLLGVGILLSTCFTINISTIYAGEVKSSFRTDSVSVSSSWTTARLFQFEAIEKILVDGLSRSTVFKKVTVGGHAPAQKSVAKRVWSDFDDFWDEDDDEASAPASKPQEVTVESAKTYLFLKPSTDKLPISVVTLERSGSAPTTQQPRGYATYTVVNPTHFYFDYVDVGRRPFDASQMSLSFMLSQRADDVRVTSSFRVNQLSFVSWLNAFLSPLRATNSSRVDMKDILLGIRMAFEAVHQYFAQHY